MVFPVPLVWVEGQVFPTMIDCLSCWKGTLFAGLAQQRFPWVLQKGGKGWDVLCISSYPLPSLLQTRTLGLCSSLLLVWGSLLASEWVLQEPLYCMNVSSSRWGSHPRATEIGSPFG